MSLEFFGYLVWSQFFCYPPVQTQDCTGKTIIVTGANVGLGKEAARQFVQLNAEKVILACRSVEKGEAARDDIEQSTGRTGVVEVYTLDLQDYDSVRDFVKKVTGLRRIDIVVENAGIQVTKFTKIAGHESTVLVNVVSTFLLALLLLPKLQETSQKFNIIPTLTIVASDMHFMAPFNEKKSSSIFDALNTPPADMMMRYTTTKLLEILAVREIAKRYPVSQLKVTVNCLTPGWCFSTLLRDSMNAAIALVMKLAARSTEVGARCLVDGGVRGPESHGKYLQDCQVHRCSALVEGPEGAEIQRRFWEELIAELEKIEPGVTKVLKA